MVMVRLGSEGEEAVAEFMRALGASAAYAEIAHHGAKQWGVSRWVPSAL